MTATESNLAVTARPIEILLVEDSPADVELTIEALKDARVANTMSHAWDGVEAMAYLRSQRAPDLVLLDLNLPKKDGREVLAEMRADPKLEMIPVVVLTTSAAEVDVLQSYQLGANAYVVKPVDFDQFLASIRSIENFWLSVVRLPAKTV